MIFLEARNWPGFSVSWEKHSRNVAKIAEAVAMAVNKYQEEYLKLPSELTWMRLMRQDFCMILAELWKKIQDLGTQLSDMNF